MPEIYAVIKCKLFFLKKSMFHPKFDWRPSAEVPFSVVKLLWTSFGKPALTFVISHIMGKSNARTGLHSHSITFSLELTAVWNWCPTNAFGWTIWWWFHKPYIRIINDHVYYRRDCLPASIEHQTGSRPICLKANRPFEQICLMNSCGTFRFGETNFNNKAGLFVLLIMTLVYQSRDLQIHWENTRWLLQ